MLSSVSTHFNYSPLRCSELKKIAATNNLKLLNIPKIFEIRWSEFSFTLVRNTLVSWTAMVLYFQENKSNAQCAGYLAYFTKLKNLKLMAFIGDVLFLFQRFQKKLESNHLTLIDMKSHVTTMVKSLEEMNKESLVGGFESNLAAKLIINEEDGKTYFKSIEMKTEENLRNRQESKDFTDVRKSILSSLQTFLTERFQIDDDLLKVIDPFVKFGKNADVQKVHSMLAPDLELANLSIQYGDILNNLDIVQNKNLNEIIIQLAKTTESRELYKELIIVLARVAALTPQSADVERCISANNILKAAQPTFPSNRKQILVHSNEYACFGGMEPNGSRKIVSR